MHINLHSRFRPVPIKKSEVGSGGCLVSSVFEGLFAPNARRYLLKRFHSTFIRLTVQPGLYSAIHEIFPDFFSPHPGAGIRKPSNPLITLSRVQIMEADIAVDST